jgi:hypothetical protein
MSIAAVREAERKTLEEGIVNLDAELGAMTADRDAWKAKYDEASILLATRVEASRLDTAITETNAWKAKALAQEDYSGRYFDMKAKAERYEKALSEWGEFREEFKRIQYHRDGMGCGLEDGYITDKYVACEYGWDRALDKVAELMPEALSTAALQEDTP